MITLEEIIKTVELINYLYYTDDGFVGGYGHIVFDDDNLETDAIEWCIEDAKIGGYDYSEETRIASLKALEAMLVFTEDEREQVMEYFDNDELFDDIKKIYDRDQKINELLK